MPREENPAAAKRALRQELRRVLGALPPPARADKSRAIAARLAALPAYREARGILFYAPLPGEADVFPLVEAAWAAGRRVFLPRCLAGGKMEIRLVAGAGQLAVAAFGIREPDPGLTDPAGPEAVDLALVPGLAFDAAGRRLGRGKGFYDRFLARLPAGAVRVAPAFDCQVVAAVPVGADDEPVNLVVTESRTLSRP